MKQGLWYFRDQTQVVPRVAQALSSHAATGDIVRIPQIPSSRAMGSNPVFSFEEFRQRTPPNQADWKGGTRTAAAA